MRGCLVDLVAAKPAVKAKLPREPLNREDLTMFLRRVYESDPNLDRKADINLRHAELRHISLAEQMMIVESPELHRIRDSNFICAVHELGYLSEHSAVRYAVFNRRREYDMDPSYHSNGGTPIDFQAESGPLDLRRTILNLKDDPATSWEIVIPRGTRGVPLIHKIVPKRIETDELGLLKLPIWILSVSVRDDPKLTVARAIFNAGTKHFKETEFRKGMYLPFPLWDRMAQMEFPPEVVEALKEHSAYVEAVSQNCRPEGGGHRTASLK
jgi:hypothetical protein